MAHRERARITRVIEISGQPGISIADLDQSERKIGMSKRHQCECNTQYNGREHKCAFKTPYI
jgi:hypothetical protein